MSKNSHSLTSSTGYWMTRLARAFEADLEKRLGPHKITRASWAVLSAIAHHDKTTPATLASFIGIDRAAITRHLDQFEKQGLIQRHQSSTDRRVVNIKLTQKSLLLVPKLTAESVATNAKFTADLAPSEADMLQSIIKKMLLNSDVIISDL